MLRLTMVKTHCQKPWRCTLKCFSPRYCYLAVSQQEPSTLTSASRKAWKLSELPETPSSPERSQAWKDYRLSVRESPSQHSESSAYPTDQLLRQKRHCFERGHILSCCFSLEAMIILLFQQRVHPCRQASQHPATSTQLWPTPSPALASRCWGGWVGSQDQLHLLR